MGNKGASCMPTLPKENYFFCMCQILLLWHNALGKMQSLPQINKTSERACSFCFVLLSWSFFGYNIVLFLCLLCWGSSRKSYFVFDSLWGDSLCGCVLHFTNNLLIYVWVEYSLKEKIGRKSAYLFRNFSSLLSVDVGTMLKYAF